MVDRLSEVGLHLLGCFERTGDITDIDNAIFHHKRAVRLLPESNADKHQYLNNLGYSFLCRFERSGDVVDIEEAISIHEDVVHLTPDGHADKPQRFDNLGTTPFSISGPRISAPPNLTNVRYYRLG